MDVALVRAVPDSFVDALRVDGGRPLDAGLARSQHQRYAALLASAGYAMEVVPADERHPDCVFIEDAAVVIGPVAVIARSGSQSRRGETGPVEAALAPRFSIVIIEAPGTLDGGDIMQLAGTVYVGRTGRTNDDGAAQLAAVCATLGLALRTVEVDDGLHLKSVVLPLDDETVLVTPDAVDETALHGLRLLYEDETERHRASALPLRDGRLMVTSLAPETARMLAAAGYDVAPIDVSELQAADGGLTCLSILFESEGAPPPPPG